MCIPVGAAQGAAGYKAVDISYHLDGREYIVHAFLADWYYAAEPGPPLYGGTVVDPIDV